MDTFVQGSWVHALGLAVCLLAAIATAVLGRIEKFNRPLRFAIVSGCLGSWILTTVYGIHPDRFTLATSIPLHFCNVANLLGAYAVATRHRTSQALMYFWSFALCLWAFLTPSLYVGPTHLWFWLFWLYHLFIPVSTAWILVADRFHPTWRDWRDSVLLTLAFMVCLAVLNAITGWNYGFVGPSKPSQPNILDFLGAYPMRLVWMVFVGTGLFALLMLPWIRRRGPGRIDLP